MDLTPATREELAEALVVASDDGRTIAVRGGGTASRRGRPATDDDSICTLGLNRVVDYAPADMIITVEGGALADDIDEAEAGLQFHLKSLGAGDRVKIGEECSGGAALFELHGQVEGDGAGTAAAFGGNDGDDAALFLDEFRNNVRQLLDDGSQLVRCERLSEEVLGAEAKRLQN